MLAQPHGLRQVIFEISMFDRKMISLANVVQGEDAGRGISITIWHASLGHLRRSRYREADRIAGSLPRSPSATAGVTQIAESFEDVLGGLLALMAGSGTVAAPSPAEREPRGMWPAAVFELLHGHEIRTGQFAVLLEQNCLDRPL